MTLKLPQTILIWWIYSTKWCHTRGPGLFSGVSLHLWHVMCDVTCDVTCHVYYSPMLMLGWWHFQNGVTQGVQGCFPVICNICDVWCVMCDVWCDMWCDKTYRTCHTYHTWHTVKISAKLVSNWPSNCCLSLCCIFLRHPLYFEATNRCLKKSKVAYFWEKLKKVKTYSSVFCKCGELYVFTFFNFSQKYATFDFFRHLLFLLTLVEFMTFWTEFTE